MHKHIITLIIFITAACPAVLEAAPTLVEARAALVSKIAFDAESPPPPKPPKGIFNKVHYPSPAGKMIAFLTPDPRDMQRHPAIIWITGGDCNAIGDLWTKTSPGNDQTASPYRKAGIVMMFPSLRGGNGNPGKHEAMLGEVDDVLAAYNFLASQPWVDPKRIYLGGHSTGGTLALLTAEMSDSFRAIFSFGPLASAIEYGNGWIFPVDFSQYPKSETLVRTPAYWLNSITTPTFVIEGVYDGNIDALRHMKEINTNRLVHFIEVEGKSHSSVLFHSNAIIAQKILRDSNLAVPFSLLVEELSPK